MNTLQTYTDIKIEREGVVAVLTMNRPEKRNALSLAMMRELDAALAQLAQDRAIARHRSARRGAGILGRSRSPRAARPRCRNLSDDFRRMRWLNGAHGGDSAAGHRRGRAVATAAGCQLVAALRSRGRLDGSDVRDTGRSHRALLQHADGGAYASGRAEARDGDVAHR